MNSLDKLLAQTADFTDPSDFLEQKFKDLDQTLRCSICGEFFDGPCLQEALGQNANCPLCRSAASEVHMRVNSVVEEIVTTWKAARPLVLKLSEESRESGTSGSSTSNLTAKRKRADPPADEDSDIEVIEAPSAPKKSKLGSRDEGEKAAAVSCPICNKEVSLQYINLHIDSGCKHTASTQNGTESKAAWSKLMTGSNKAKGKERDLGNDPIPMVSYDTMKEKQIRALLEEQDLPINGDKATLIARHRKWRVIFNANLDKSEKLRKTRRELKKDLHVWEEQTANKKDNKVDDIGAYARRNGTEFARLVEAARPTKQEPKADCSYTRSNGMASRSPEHKDEVTMITD